MRAEMAYSNWKGQRDETSEELAKRKTYAVGYYESVIYEVLVHYRVIPSGLIMD